MFFYLIILLLFQNVLFHTCMSIVFLFDGQCFFTMYPLVTWVHLVTHGGSYLTTVHHVTHWYYVL